MATATGKARGRPLKDIPLSRLLGITFGILTAIAIGAVLFLTVTANVRNTFSLLNVRAQETVQSLELLLEAYLEPPEITVMSIAGQLSRGEVDFDDDEEVFTLLRGAITANRMAVVMVLIDPEFRGRGVLRQGSEFRRLREEKVANPLVQVALELVPMDARSVWGPLVYEGGIVHANVVSPVVRNGELKGYVVAALPLPRISQLTAQIGKETLGTPFILDGADHVLAHPSLAQREDQAGPLPDTNEELYITNNKTGVAPPEATIALTDFTDPVLRALGERDEEEGFEVNSIGGLDFTDVSVGSEDYLILSSRITKYAPRPWVIGVHFAEDTVNEEIRRLFGSTAVGLFLLVVAAFVAAFVGRRMGRPIASLNAMAQRITTLDFDNVKPLGPSRIREFNQASLVLNHMVDALRAFSAYVPRSLVMRLVEDGGSAARSQERTVTVMFTDIVGFTAMSEQLSAAETAEFLNAHFELLCGAVEETGGTVDKFMGDGMMAFWGAPDELPDHPERACEAAKRMAEALRTDNEKRKQIGEWPVHLRIGIHTGPVIVGNIGTHERINYTIVGDTVNTCQRLEALGKVVAPNDPLVALISAQTDAIVSDTVVREPLNAFHVPGRDAPIQVHRLVL